MIVVKIELKSAIDDKRSRPLGVMVICNDGKGTKSRGDYDVAASKWPKGKEYTGRVENFPRGSRSVFELLRRALNTLEVP